MKRKITKALLEQLAVPDGGREFLVFDSELTGYAVKVTVAGSKRFLLQYSRDGKTHRLTLGRWGDVSEADARKQAKIALGELAAGGHPVERRAIEREARKVAGADRQRDEEAKKFTIDELVSTWTAIGLKSAGKRHLADAPRGLRHLLAEFLDKPAQDLTRVQAQKAVDDLAARVPVRANRLRTYGRKAFSFAVDRGLVETNPFLGVKPAVKEQSRERVLSDDELGEVWRAAGLLIHPWSGYVRFLLLTLQRRMEVAGMTWRELSDDLTTWTLPGNRVKNKRAHIVHLAEPARTILRGIPRTGKFVFSTRGRQKQLNSYTKMRGWLNAKILEERALSGADNQPALDWTFHDFRRAGVTTLAGLGFSVAVADRLLNHVTGSVSGVMRIYQRNEFLAERERALEAWAAHVLQQAERKPGARAGAGLGAVPADIETK